MGPGGNATQGPCLGCFAPILPTISRSAVLQASGFCFFFFSKDQRKKNYELASMWRKDQYGGGSFNLKKLSMYSE